MIYARSPYIVHVDDSGLESIEFKLYIYTGTKDDATDKGTPEYTFAVDAVNGEVTFDISPYILDVLDNIRPLFLGTYIWVTTEIAKDTGAGMSAFSAYEDTQLACNGYTQHDEGVNNTTYTINDLEQETGGLRFVGCPLSAAAYPVEEQVGAFDDGKLLYWVCRKKGKGYVLPVFTDDSASGAVSVRFYSGLGGQPGGSSEVTTTTITSASIDEHDGNLKYVTIPAAARSFAVRLGTVDVSNGNVHDIEGDCETNIKLCFLNKFGVIEEIHFAGREMKEYSTSSSQFNRSVLASGAYSTWKHPKKVYEKTAEETITVNSGYYPEGYNEQFKQLLLSEYVWMLPNGLGDAIANYVPVIVKDSSIKYKYRRFDKVINYTLTLEFAGNHINDIK